MLLTEGLLLVLYVVLILVLPPASAGWFHELNASAQAAVLRQVAEPELRRRAGAEDAGLEDRRVRVRSYLIPSSDVHVCRGVGQLVQSMQKNFKYRCGEADVFTSEVRERILNGTMPAIEQWIAQTLLVPSAAMRERRRPPLVSSDLGVCEGMLRGYLPRHHVRETGHGQGAADAVREFGFPFAGATGIAARTGRRSVARGGLWNKQRNEYDLVIYVTTMLSALFVDAFPCQFDAVTGRPTVLHLNLDPGLYSMDVGLSDSAVAAALFQERLALREVVVAMSTKNFLAAQDPTYYRDVGGVFAPLPRSAVLNWTVRPEGVTVPQWVRPALVDAARRQLGCGAVGGAQVDASADYYGAIGGSYLLGRMFNGEALSYDAVDVVFGNVTLAALRASGWWEVDDAVAEIEANGFGYGSGCAFGDRLCSQAPWRVVPNGTVLDGGVLRVLSAAVSSRLGTAAAVNTSELGALLRGSQVSNASLWERSFCFDETERSCDTAHRGSALCDVRTYSGPLPLSMQYFEGAPNKGGSLSRTAYCPLFMSSFQSCAGATPSPYDDSYCFVRGLPREVEVQWNASLSTAERVAVNVTVLRRNGTACFRVVGCAASVGGAGSFDVVSMAGSEWQVASTCIDDGRGGEAVFTWEGAFYACPRFAVVCASLLQRESTVLPLQDQEASLASVPAWEASPQLSQRRVPFPHLDSDPRRITVYVGGRTSAADGAAFWNMTSQASQLDWLRGWVQAQGIRVLGDGVLGDVPVEVEFTAPHATACALGCVVRLALPAASPLADCRAADGSVLTLPSGGGSIVAFLNASGSGALLRTSVARCTFNGSQTRPGSGDAGLYRELSVLSVVPVAVRLNATSGLYTSGLDAESVLAALQRNDTSRLLTVRPVVSVRSVNPDTDNMNPLLAWLLDGPLGGVAAGARSAVPVNDAGTVALNVSLSDRGTQTRRTVVRVVLTPAEPVTAASFESLTIVLQKANASVDGGVYYDLSYSGFALPLPLVDGRGADAQSADFVDVLPPAQDVVVACGSCVRASDSAAAPEAAAQLFVVRNGTAPDSAAMLVLTLGNATSCSLTTPLSFEVDNFAFTPVSSGVSGSAPALLRPYAAVVSAVDRQGTVQRWASSGRGTGEVALLRSLTNVEVQCKAVGVSPAGGSGVSALELELTLAGVGLRSGDTLVVQFDDTQYRRDAMMRHPWPNATVRLDGCYGTNATAEWGGTQLTIRLTSVACVAPGWRYGVRVDGFYTPASLPVGFYTFLRRLELVRSGVTVVGAADVGAVSLEAACGACSWNGVCQSSACACFVGYGGPTCAVCSTMSQGAQCAYACDGGAPVPQFPPRYIGWRDECRTLGGFLDPQRGCQCYCNGTLCLLSRSASQSFEMTLTETTTATVSVSKQRSSHSLSRVHDSGSMSEYSLTHLSRSLTGASHSVSSTYTRPKEVTETPPTGSHSKGTRHTYTVTVERTLHSAVSLSRSHSLTLSVLADLTRTPSLTCVEYDDLHSPSPSMSEVDVSVSLSSHLSPTLSSSASRHPTSRKCRSTTRLPSSTVALGISSTTFSQSSVRVYQTTPSSGQRSKTVTPTRTPVRQDPPMFTFTNTGALTPTLTPPLKISLFLFSGLDPRDKWQGFPTEATPLSIRLAASRPVFNETFLMQESAANRLQLSVLPPYMVVSIRSFRFPYRETQHFLNVECFSQPLLRNVLTTCVFPLLRTTPTRTPLANNETRTVNDDVEEPLVIRFLSQMIDSRSKPLELIFPQDQLPTSLRLIKGADAGAPEAEAVFVLLVEPNVTALAEFVDRAKMFHAVAAHLLFVGTLVVNPLLASQVQLYLLVSVLAPRSDFGCAARASAQPSTLFARVLSPAYVQHLVLLGGMMRGEADEDPTEPFPVIYLDRLSLHCALALCGAALLVALFVAARQKAGPLLSRLVGWAAASGVALLVVEPSFAFGSALGDAARATASASSVGAVFGWLLASLVIAAGAVLVAVLLLWRNCVSPEAGAHFCAYESLPEVRARWSQDEVRSWLEDLSQSRAERDRWWSSCVARLVAVRFPPLYVVPVGYWTFTARFPGVLCAIVESFPRRAFSPLVYVALHFVCVGMTAFVFGLVGAEQVCLDVRRDDVSQLSTLSAAHGAIPFRAGMWVIFGLFAGLGVGSMWLRLWRSRLQVAFSVLLLLSASVEFLCFSLAGTVRHGGLLTSEFFDAGDDGDAVDARLTVLLIVLDALLVALALTLVVERWVLNRYMEELDAAMFSHLRLHESIEMLLLHGRRRGESRRRSLTPPSPSSSSSSSTSSLCDTPVARYVPPVNPLNEYLAQGALLPVNEGSASKPTATPPPLVRPPRRKGHQLMKSQPEDFL